MSRIVTTLMSPVCDTHHRQGTVEIGERGIAETQLYLGTRRTVCDPADDREFAIAIDAAVHRAKVRIRAFFAWFVFPPQLPAHPTIYYSQEPGTARAVRQRRIQAAVDDLLVPPGLDVTRHSWTWL